MSDSSPPNPVAQAVIETENAAYQAGYERGFKDAIKLVYECLYRTHPHLANEMERQGKLVQPKPNGAGQ